ncbi:MAG: cysteine methyltransferase [Verrucomicrobia bacterium]|nr:cysteine methyltransferase [Verrucomicrobiota bacterium]|tara:strand:- start:222 stop:593 length:372 start_codon:yes stop_codon:yes gene_type:complete
MLKKETKLNERNEDFFEAVYQVVRLIPKGRVTSYGAIAAFLGSKQSARAVGWAMNASHRHQENLPAHRVVNRIGMLSGKHHFAQDNSMQNRLASEGVVVLDNQIQQFEKLFWDPSKEIKLDGY